MTIPQAVAPSVKTPGLYLTVDLLGANANAGSAVNAAVIMSPQNSTGGDITNDTEVRQVFGPDDVRTALGAGNPGHLAAKQFFKRFGTGRLYVISPTPSAGAAATATQTFTGSATENSTVRFRVHGRTVDVAWNSGEANTVFIARAVAAINGRGDDLFVTVAANTDDIDYTAKALGPWGNDVRIDASIIAGGAGITIGANPATLTAGATEPDFTTALAQIATTEYLRIIPCLSNADASDATATSNAERVKDHINANETGASAKLQVGVVGHTGTIANVSAGAVGRNDEAFEYIYGQDFEDLPSELAGNEAGDALRFIAIRANYNRIGNKPVDLKGPRDVVASKLTPGEIEALLNTGVSPYDLEQLTNEVTLVRPITTHSLDGANPDFRALDLPDTDGMYTVSADLRTVLPTEFANASVTEDIPPGGDDLPPGVIERRDIQAFIIARLRLWVGLGVVQQARLDASIADGSLVVEINSSDPTQVDIFLPLAIIKPLAKLGVVTSKVA